MHCYGGPPKRAKILTCLIRVHAWFKFFGGCGSRWLEVHSWRSLVGCWATPFDTRLMGRWPVGYAVAGLRFSPDNARVLTYTNEGGLRIWDTATQALLFSHKTEDRIFDFTFFPGGDRFAAVHADSASIWHYE